MPGLIFGNCVPTLEQCLIIYAALGGGYLLFGAATAAIPAFVLKRRWPFLLTPFFAAFWGGLSFLALQAIYS